MKFEKTIHINEVNPKSATVVEMRALEVHMGGKEAGRLYFPSDGSRGYGVK